ncbi:uncharacterized protein K452DRAFT_240935 [Aplosporella prunicola CBS 121167]|uniref:DNA repair protein REV1 n=1 Tax=Aplosporella prunicola CBS 121167 TaxID=1176127 RepID=A0A6A6BTY8_9PEZI|nr:uncharacterized protein K452DRAFT_240935 [Aplosporella prunicola CBS 121167]KAF2147460.1 hypothetical protein K452DRAFT_240935 [Aplosporella prunicola CBS 121167]
MGSRLENNSNAVRKRIENHAFDNEEGEEYEGSKFGGFGDYFWHKRVKLQNLDAEIRSQAGHNPPIFRGIVAHVNGYTQPSLNDLHKLIVSYGGGFMQYLDGKTAVTHIIASNLTPKKAVEFRKYRIVKPAWVVDSIKSGKLLPWDAYRVVDEGAGQKLLGSDGGKIVNQTPAKSKGYREQTDVSWYTKHLQGGENSTPRSSQRPPYLMQQSSTPGVEDEIDDLPPSHQPETSFTRDSLSELERHEALGEHLPLIPHSENGQLVSPGILDSEEISDIDRNGPKRPYGDQTSSPCKRRKLTAEEHNAILLADPNIRKSTVVNPDFLEQYYRESRLHHLSTWKADLKTQLQAMAAEKSSSQKAKQKAAPGVRRYILHVDFDSFFAAVSLLKRPEFKDKPAVVAHGNGTGSEIASCNYPAREHGIKNGMWMKRAQELCPELKILPYDFPAYEDASRSFYDAILSIEGVVQSVSIDEALIDVSAQCIAAGGSDGKKMSEGSIYREQSEAEKIAQHLRDEVKIKTDCAVSVGIGPNILCAKLALRKAKPAGQYQIKPEEVLDFIGKLEVTNLPGVAYSIGGKLEEAGIKFVRDIRELTKERLITVLGPKTGEKVWDYSRGIDRSEVGDQVIRKSVSAEVNWGVRFENAEQVDDFITNLCGELGRRLLKEKVKGRQLTMKIMRRAADAPLDPPKHLGHGKCDVYNKSTTLGIATNDKDILAKEASSMLKSFKFSPGELRGIGIQMTKLEPLKASVDGKQESSQRLLQFKIKEKNNPVSEEPGDPIQDDIKTPRKQKADPEQFEFGATQLNTDSPSRKPLNVMGTQFIMPTQVDPTVLAELPEDIRMKLLKRVQPSPVSPKEANIAVPSVEVESKDSNKPLPRTMLPNESQLDPADLAVLPPDVRAEVLSFYRQSPGASPSRGDRIQTRLPQSPRKNRTIALPKRAASASFAGPRRGRPPKSTSANPFVTNRKTFTQSNFITERLARQQPDSAETTTDDAGTDAEVDAEFLAALPEDIRQEVIDEQRRLRLRKQSSLNLAAARKNQPAQQPPALPSGQRTLKLPPRPPRPTFSMQKIWRPDELREAVRDWVKEFKEEGPYQEDLGALNSYLQKVVEEEKDLEKAVGVCKWFAWVCEEEFEGFGKKGGDGFDGGEWKEAWMAALRSVQNKVQEAVKTRGSGAVEF